MPATDAADCPSCWTDEDDETGCPHLLEGDACPNCGDELTKPRSGKVECPNCRYTIAGQNTGHELRDFNLTHRQAQRFLVLFGYDIPVTPGSSGNTLRAFCHDHDLDMDELNDVLADLRGLGAYSDD